MKKAQITNGVVSNIVLVDNDNVPDWCKAWPEATEDAVIGGAYLMGVFYPVVDPSPTADDVNNERNTRMSSTFLFNGIRYDCDQKSLARITGAATLAGFAIASGAQPSDFLWHGGATPFTWIAANNAMVEMDAFTMFEFGKTAAHNESAHIFAARVLKDMNPIPVDYRDGKHWP